MSVAGESGNRAQHMREKVQQLTDAAERTTDPQERQKLQEQARRLQEQTKQQWGYHPAPGYRMGTDLIGFTVEAADGSIGKIDKHSDDVGAAYLVVDTGVWIFGKHVLLPAGTITCIDTAEEKVYVDRTKDAPEFDKDKHTGDPNYLEQLGKYYGQHM